MAGGKPAGYSQAWPRIWTQYYHEQIQLVVRAGLELRASELQVQAPVVQTLDSTTHRINHYPADKY